MKQALEGIRILDISSVIAGPFGASILGDFGADVIKVELPGVGDSARQLTPLIDGKPCRFQTYSRNKKHITLDLHREKGREVFLKMVAKSDVIMENFRTGTLDKWGLGMETLRRANPDIIVARVTGYGQTGPRRYMSGFGSAVTAFSGMQYINGREDTPPLFIGFSVADYCAGLCSARGVLLALQNRANGGKASQEIDVSLYEGLTRMMEGTMAQYQLKGIIQGRDGAKVEGAIPSGCFETKDGEWISIVCGSDKTLGYALKAFEREDLLPYGGDIVQRAKNEKIFMEAFKAWFGSKTTAEALEICEREKVPVAKVYNVRDMFEDPHYAARGDIVEMDDDVFGRLVTPAVFPILSETPGEIKWMGRAMGADNDEIYKGWLGLSDAEMQELKDDGAI